MVVAKEEEGKKKRNLENRTTNLVIAVKTWSKRRIMTKIKRAVKLKDMQKYIGSRFAIIGRQTEGTNHRKSKGKQESKKKEEIGTKDETIEEKGGT